MAIFAQDSFADTNATALTSHVPTEIGTDTPLGSLSWVANSVSPNGVPTIDSNQCSTGGGLVGVHFSGGTPATAEYDLETDFVVSGALSGALWITVRATTGHVNYSAGYNGGVWEIRKWTGGTNSSLLTSTSAGTPTVATHTWKLTVRDSGGNVDVKFYYDGAEVLSTTDSSSVITAAGFPGITSNAVSNMRLDRFKATDAGGGGGGTKGAAAISASDPFLPKGGMTREPNYSVPFAGGTVTNAGGNADLWEFLPADDKPIKLRGFGFGQISEVADAAEEAVEIQILRMAATVTGSNGSAVTPVPMDSADTAAGFTAEINGATVATTSGATTIVASVPWNLRASPTEVWAPDERFAVKAKQGEGLFIRLLTTVADDVTFGGTAWVEEE